MRPEHTPGLVVRTSRIIVEVALDLDGRSSDK